MANRNSVVRSLLFLGGLAVGGGLFIFLVWKSDPEQVWASLLAFGLLPLLGFIGISLLNFCFYTLRWKLILDAMLPRGRRVPFNRLFLHRMSGFAAGYLTPAAQVAGEPIRVAMLRSDDVPFREATGSVVLDLAFEITSFVLYVGVGLGFAFAQGLTGDGGFLWPMVFISVILLGLIFFFASTISGGGFFHKSINLVGLNRWKPMRSFSLWLQETEALMSQFFVGKFWTIVFVSALSLITVASRAVEAMFITHFLGVDIAVTEAFLISTLPGVSLLLPIPGGLGVFEGSNAALFTLLGIQVNAVAYTIIIRVRDFLFIAAGVFHAIVNGEKIFGAKSYEKRS